MLSSEWSVTRPDSAGVGREAGIAGRDLSPEKPEPPVEGGTGKPGEQQRDRTPHRTPHAATAAGTHTFVQNS